MSINCRSSQARCLLDHGSSAGQLDHSAEGTLPGERFGANQQCKTMFYLTRTYRCFVNKTFVVNFDKLLRLLTICT